MALIPVVCPHCQADRDVVKNGKTAQGKQRFLCRSEICQGRTFMLNPSYPGRTSAVKEQIVEMSLNGSGIRDIARVLQVSTRTVIGELKKTRSAQSSE
ncbi:IS1-like element transposase [Leptolyngbya sp. GB1-A1]|uniref:IS1/IS1595 family N-terminal zinc-binding domain-containing protein n=1 Tax=unclassified Leptolyngbya TaxID=2650499 RepID=UPI003298C2A8